ncbi:uncharacterized protein EV420DRAFT_383470 [Desarmillaria tabescens]|uniref:Fatty acid desaturase domain-containing protein n=1 Tax=Armillaria tabescens TaxID=1929756 RepID=A0AA39KBM6_ARMTA|nr:uncharacterized protein EV420DRAFT_383470 [Desarmillaria tabescens]KAK0458174.1 hypothetical protein EV420DRAFT_383470 [Desarmillaria tabescens]
MGQQLIPSLPTKNFHELRRAIPAHLFQCSNVTSLWLLVRDIAMSLVLACGVSQLDALLSSMIWQMALLKYICLSVPWIVYWWFQGLVLTGIWVIGHECGHGSFFTSQLICDVVGFVCHSALWTPYLSWKITHRSHHRHHASMEKDEHWIPRTRSEVSNEDSLFEDTPILTGDTSGGTTSSRLSVLFAFQRIWSAKVSQGYRSF